MLDTILTLLGPALVRRGIDSGVTVDDPSGLWTSVALFAVVGLVDWGVVWAYTVVTGRTAERALFALRVKIFGHLQRTRLDYYDAELDGRIMTRMTTDVEALSQLVQTGLINGVVGIFTCIGRLRVPDRAVAAARRGDRARAAAVDPRHVVVPPAVVAWPTPRPARPSPT